MAVNRFEQPAQARFINTFSPLPFDQLYQLGKNAQENVDRALSQLTDTYSKWSDFQSPSAIDMAAWNRETFDRTKDIVERLSNNLDLIKTAEGRSDLYGTLNNLNYDKLSQLKQSRDNIIAGQKYRAQLAAAGKYNPDWHDVQWSEYDTLNNGVFNDIAPLAYQDIRSLVDPYVANIKPSYLGTDGGYDYVGISSDRIKEAVDQNLSSLLSTPEANKHIEVIMRNNPGMTQHEAASEFYKQALQDAMYKVSQDRTPNVYEQARFVDNLRGAREKSNLDLRYSYQERIQGLKNAGTRGSASSYDIIPDPARLTDLLIIDGTNTLDSRISSNQQLFPNTKNIIEQLNDSTITTDKKLELSKSINNAISKDIQSQYDAIINNKQLSKKIEDRRLLAVENTINLVSSNLSSLGAKAILSQVSPDEKPTIDGDDYIFGTSKGMMLFPTVASKIINRDLSEFSKDKDVQKLSNSISSGKFKNIRARSLGEVITYTDREGRPVQGIKLRISIPEDEFKNKGFSSSIFTSSAGSGRSSAKVLGGYEELRKVSNVSSDKPKKFITIDVVKEIPNDANIQQAINQEYLNYQTSKTYSNAQYEEWQRRSLGIQSQPSQGFVEDSLDDFEYFE